MLALARYLVAVCFAWIGLFLLSDIAAAQLPDTEVQSEAARAEEIDRWIVELDSDKFQTRQAATNKLKEAGKAAIAPLAKAARAGSAEVTTRAIDVLATYYKSADPATQAAAKQALEELRKSENRSAANLAARLLTPPAAAPQRGVPLFVPAAPGLQVAAQRVSVKSKTENGTRVIDIDENGKQIQIKEAPDKSLEVTITETVEGKPKSTKYTAKDADELKQKHAEAYQYYSRYGANRQPAIGNIQIGGLPIQLGVARAARPRVLTAAQKKALEDLNAAEAEYKSAVEALRKAAMGQPSGAELEKLAAQIEAANTKLASAKKALEE